MEHFLVDFLINETEEKPEISSTIEDTEIIKQIKDLLETMQDQQ